MANTQVSHYGFLKGSHKSGHCIFLLLFQQIATQLVQLPIYCCQDDQETALAKTCFDPVQGLHQ